MRSVLSGRGRMRLERRHAIVAGLGLGLVIAAVAALLLVSGKSKPTVTLATSDSQLPATTTSVPRSTTSVPRSTTTARSTTTTRVDTAALALFGGSTTTTSTTVAPATTAPRSTVATVVTTTANTATTAPSTPTTLAAHSTTTTTALPAPTTTVPPTPAALRWFNAHQSDYSRVFVTSQALVADLTSGASVQQSEQDEASSQAAINALQTDLPTGSPADGAVTAGLNDLKQANNSFARALSDTQSGDSKDATGLAASAVSQLSAGEGTINLALAGAGVPASALITEPGIAGS